MDYELEFWLKLFTLVNLIYEEFHDSQLGHLKLQLKVTEINPSNIKKIFILEFNLFRCLTMNFVRKTDKITINIFCFYRSKESNLERTLSNNSLNYKRFQYWHKYF